MKNEMTAESFGDIHSNDRRSGMSTAQFKERDFEHPSTLFVLEDALKGLIGGLILYNPYFKTFKLKGNEKVLDFGCGGGTGSRSLLKFLNPNGHLTCVDTSNFWIDKARKRLSKYSNVELHAGDIQELNIPDSEFDVITVFHVIHDIPSAERPETVKSLARKLKKNGTVFVREPTKKSHGMPADEIRALFSEAGFKETGRNESKSEYIGKFQKLNQ
jgi:ubiquinone/menaquinone biosynthesis C-methylase UbiE